MPASNIKYNFTAHPEVWISIIYIVLEFSMIWYLSKSTSGREIWGTTRKLLQERETGAAENNVTTVVTLVLMPADGCMPVKEGRDCTGQFSKTWLQFYESKWLPLLQSQWDQHQFGRQLYRLCHLFSFLSWEVGEVEQLLPASETWSPTAHLQSCWAGTSPPALLSNKMAQLISNGCILKGLWGQF